MANNKKMMKKVQEVKKGIEEEVLFMLRNDMKTQEIQHHIKCVTDEQIEVWPEIDLMEIVLEHDSLIFENMMDTFDTKEDIELLDSLKVKKVYSIIYNTLDFEQVKKVLLEIKNICDGFIASDTDDLEPMYEIEDFE